MTVRRGVWLAGAAMALAGAALGCSIALKSKLGTTTAQQVLMDDSCGLQDYFDTLTLKKAAAPALVSSSDLEKTTGKRAAGGRSRFAFATEFQLKHLRRVLADSWRPLPGSLVKAERIEIEVRWAERAGVRRVLTDENAEIVAGDESWSLAFHPCLNDLLFGEPLYHTRRDLLGLPPLPDAGIDGGHSDARDGATGGKPPGPPR